MTDHSPTPDDEDLSGPAADDLAVFSVEPVDVVTYPWEWPNSLLESAALLTLDLRARLLGLGLDLKDASAFNVQFRGMRPVFIDLGSIERWRPNPSWNASRQFIEHFINPLAVGSGDRVTAESVLAEVMTDKATVEVVEMVLSGLVNKRIVQAINDQGGRAVGISGKDDDLMVCVADDPELGFVGRPVEMNVQVKDRL